MRKKGNQHDRLVWQQLRDAPDAELVRELRRGNDDAFAALVDRYQRLVFSVALRIIKNQCEAEDVVQTVFTEIYRRLELFDPSRGTLKMWVLQYAYSRSLNRRHYLEQRQFYTQVGIDEVAPELASDTGRGRGGFSTREAALLVKEAMDALSRQQQTAITLIYFRGLTLEEAAAETGETLSALRHHYYRGMAALRELVTANRRAEIRDESASEIATGVANLRARTI